ncbi:extensin [Sphingosinicella humi]|uniref:Extensin n=1 Tax=Allosphingosinicella humi TaxID=2068657 RepID=A0A2U2J379_9SPHN|nr:extensin family protein [Sphingosinicella humi]PWG02787.1 extensin [Sphingosinicella humi]
MGRRGLILATLLLAGCIPSSEPRRAEPSREEPRAARSDPDTRQCLADLSRERVRFEVLPDRNFGGGCSAIGAVQLLDIGTPTANLGAMTCPLAREYARWTRQAVQPAARSWLSSDVVKIESFGTYACRPVNGMAGGKLSEHGRANAVDISAFVLRDGRRITVLEGWNSDDDDVRAFLRAVHQAGCRRFGITLGPEANSLHHNHFHFDMGQGPYCR